jgi:hypothetical protein
VPQEDRHREHRNTDQDDREGKTVALDQSSRSNTFPNSSTVIISGVPVRIVTWAGGEGNRENTHHPARADKRASRRA